MQYWNSLQLSDVELAYRTTGENAGPLVIFIHGFPDTAEAFDFMLEPCQAIGWHAISLETRGYPPSGLAPAGSAPFGDYSLPVLARDVTEVIKRLGYASAVVVGHDWGSVIAAGVGAFFPERLRAAVLVGFPHISRAKVTIGGLLQRPHHLLFQFGTFGRWLTARNDLAYLDRMYRVWSPSWQVPPEYMARVKNALREPERLRAVLEYYVQIWRMRNDQNLLAMLAKPLNVPGLVIGGLDEPEFRQRWLRDSRDCFRPPAEIEFWPGVGHWPHSEAPDAFRDHILEFLRQNVSTVTPGA